MAATQIRGANNGSGTSQIKAGTISNADIHASAAIALSKLAEAVIQADGGQAFTADQSMGGFKLTNLGTPTAGTDAATKTYVDGVTAGLSWKTSVKAATTTNGALATAYEDGDTIDGYTLVTGDRILIKDQTTATENGIYIVAASGAPSRSTDADAASELNGAAVFVENGTTNADTGWVQINTITTLGSDNVSFTQFTGTGSITAGTGLTKTGNTINANAADSSITMNADDFAVAHNTTGGLETSSGIRIKLDSTTDGYATIATGSDGARVVNVKNANIASDAAIAFSKLASLTSGNILVGSAGNVATSVAMSGDATIVASGAVTLAANILREADIVTRETPSGSVNGSNVTFTLANTPVTGTEHVYLNGLLQDAAGEDYSISGTTITMTVAPQTGDKIRVSYWK